MPGELHRHAFRRPSSGEIADRGPTEVVRKAAWAPGGDPGLPPRFVKTAGGDALTSLHSRGIAEDVAHDRVLGEELCRDFLLLLKNPHQTRGHGKYATLTILRRASTETNFFWRSCRSFAIPAAG